MNRHARAMKAMILCTEIKITYLVSQLIITRIVSNSKDDRIFSMKYMKMKFYKYFRDKKLLERFIKLIVRNLLL